MTISNIPTSDLVKDYNKIDLLEKEYFTLCKKYSSNTYESDESFYIIKQELGHRQVNGIDVKTADIPDIENFSETQKNKTTCPVCGKILEKVTWGTGEIQYLCNECGRHFRMVEIK